MQPSIATVRLNAEVRAAAGAEPDNTELVENDRHAIGGEPHGFLAGIAAALGLALVGATGARLPRAVRF